MKQQLHNNMCKYVMLRVNIYKQIASLAMLPSVSQLTGWITEAFEAFI